MKVEWRTRSKKTAVTFLSALLLAGHMPVNVVAQEVDELNDSTEVSSEEVELVETEEQSSEEVEQIETEEQSIEEVKDDKEVSDNEEDQSESEIEPEIEPRTFETVSEFIHNFEESTTEEINIHIDKFKLFSDDAGVLHSVIEEVNEEINDLEQNSLHEIIFYLQEIREENLIELEKNPNAANKDLIEEDIDVSTDNQQMETFSAQRSMMTTSSIKTMKRIEGADRYETAISISKAGWKSADTVVIVEANGFADALAGAPLAKALNAPILLSGKTNGTAKTLKEIERLGAKKAVILGGESAVPKSIESQLKTRNVNSERIAGPDRYETSKLISDRVIQLTGTKKAVLVSGLDFADAMSVAPFASERGMPIYLTKTNTFVSQVQEASNTIKDWTIIGGYSAVDGTVGRKLKNKSTNYTRIEGKDRYETNKKVLKHFGVKSNQAYVATGLEFMDALSGSVLAAKQSTGVILVKNSESELNKTVSFIKDLGFSQLSLFGGVAAINERMEGILKDLKLPSPKPVVFIDIGHGGSDPGAQYSGYKEKDIVLPTSLMLRDLLVKSGDYRIVMSRETDKYLTLAQRSSMANDVQADISISIHVNAMGGQWAGLAKGIETFIYHPTYQTSRLAFNMNNYRIKESLRLADAVHNSLIKNTGLANRGVRGANLHMVREPKMPAILPELGFINNPGDLSIVTKHNFQKTAAESIKQGIDIYFSN